MPILYQTTFMDTAIVRWFKLINLKLDVDSYYINKYNFKLTSKWLILGDTFSRSSCQLIKSVQYTAPLSTDKNREHKFRQKLTITNSIFQLLILIAINIEF